MRIETDKVKKMIPKSDDMDFGNMVARIANLYMNPSDIISLASVLMNVANVKVVHMESAAQICYEKGSCIKSYLEGNMWETEEDAKKNVQPQIENARMIVDVCKRK